MVEALLTVQEATAQLTAPGEFFETARHEIEGVTMTVWRNAPASLRHLLEDSRRFGDREFLVYGETRQTFDAHYRRARTVGHRLAQAGVRPGDRVAIAARNLPDWVASFWGTVAIGAVAVPLNAWWSRDELLYGLEDSGAVVAFVDRERHELIVSVRDQLTALRDVIVLADEIADSSTPLTTTSTGRPTTFDEFLGDPIDDPWPFPTPDADAAATMFYTSGTTGRPKGAVGTHRNALTNVMNLFFLNRRAALRYPATSADPGQTVSSASLLNIPLFHATGCLSMMLVNVAAGHKLVLTHHFDPLEALEIIERERISLIGGVPTVVMQILDQPRFSDFDTSSVRLVSYGGAPAPPQLVRRIREAFRLAEPGNGYGLTETAAAVAVNSGADYLARPTSCGVAVPVCDVAIVPEDYPGAEPPADVAPDTVGELWIKGPNVIRGYWNRPEETRATISNGWLHTGDLARIDAEGFIHIVDRAKDVIIRGGENVYSTAVEAALFDHPDVTDCAVVGLPHAIWGEEVVAIVVLRPTSTLNATDLQRHVAGRLARFEVPTRFVFRTEALPRNPQGKLLKRQLRSEVLEESAPPIADSRA